MGAFQRKLISAAIIAFVLVHLSYYIHRDEHWPILGYPMYANVVGKEFSCMVVYAVPADSAQPAFPVDFSHGVSPFQARWAFKKILHHPHRSPQYDRLAPECPAMTRADERQCVSQKLAAAALRSLAAVYERERAAAPQLTPIRSLRLYEVTYRLSAGTVEVIDKQLLAEATK